ncbi:MAG TPA: rhomboid family intramembrane serine protease [Pilimelia sp.]|nr:rhomboid family intramembrane serine protease [Pilimelia sp.]
MTERPPETVPMCYRHPTRETWVRCTRCDRPICPDCMREAAVGFQCPECVAEGRRTQRPARTAFGGSDAGRFGYVTKALIALNVLAFVASVASAGSADAVAGGTGFGGLLGSSTPLTDWGGILGRAIFQGETEISGIAEGEYYRLITAMFLHYGILHLLMNMWALFVLGRDLEAALGPVRFAALYLLAGLGGNVAVYALTLPNAPPTAGASTAVFGLFAALFVLLRRLRRDTSAIVPILVINLIFTFTVPRISIQGHIGGLVAGAVVAAILAYAPPRRRTLVQAVGLSAVLALFLLLVISRTVAILGA